jgi:CheY-like chemotaxis protein
VTHSAPQVEVLLVEDNDADVELTLRSLQKGGHLTNPVHVVRDGQEALDYMFCSGAYSDRQIDDTPKVILLDIQMPRIDGLEVLRRLKADERTKRVPVVLLTSSQEDQDMVRGYGDGANSYIVKPVDFEKFGAVMAGLGMYWMLLNRIPYGDE